MGSSAKQFGLGILPLLIGFLYNYVILWLPVPIFLVNLAFLILWGFLCYRVLVPGQSIPLQLLRICLFGAVMLALALYQELVNGAYFSGFWGLASQFYFLPGMSLCGALISPFLDVIRPYLFYIAEYVCMCLICLATCLGKCKKKPAV